MENRSYALLAGAFTLLLLIATLVIAVIINHEPTALIAYEIISDRAVNGLSTQSLVNYQGVAVGKVVGLSLDPATPGRVRIRIGIEPQTPITESTWAELAVQGVTGLAHVDLRDKGTSRVRLAVKKGVIPVIPLRPGLFDRFSEDGNTILQHLAHITTQLSIALDTENLQALRTSLQNAVAVSNSLKVISEQLAPVAYKIGPLVDNLHGTIQQVRRTTHNMDGLIQQVRQGVSHFQGPDGALTLVTQNLREISIATSQLSNETLPAVTHMANQISTAARRVGDTPQSLLFGAPPPQPGPGEGGFVGFKQIP